MKKIVGMLTLGLLLVVGVVVMKRRDAKEGIAARYTIGILQTASHPALDAVREGFTQELTRLLGDEVAYDVRNVQGSVSQAHATAQQFHVRSSYGGFLAIATPAAQSLFMQERERPIFIAAVTDPHALGMMHSTSTVCGTSDMIDTKAMVNMLVSLVPQAQKIGILYTMGELNSVVLVQRMKEELQARGLMAFEFAVSNESDIPTMTEVACRKADAIMCPTDNTVASAIDIVTTLARKHKKPLLVSDATLVARGALASCGVDYRESGKQTARIAYKVLVEGKKPFALGIEQARAEKIMVNAVTAQQIGVPISNALKEQITLIAEEQK